MTVVKSAAWCSYVSVVKEFLGKTKADCYQDIVKQMLTNFQAVGARMSIKIHYLFSHLGRFPENLGEVSEEQGERFHQAIKNMEMRYQGRRDSRMMSNYCWSLMRVSTQQNHKRKSYKRFIHAYELMLGLHVFRQTGPPRRVDCLAPPSVCHIKTEASR